MRRVKLTRKEIKLTLMVSALSSIGVLVIAAVVGAVAQDDGAELLIAIVVGLTVGVLARSFANYGWRTAGTHVADGNRMPWTAKSRIGLAWRAVVIFIAGQLLIGALDEMAWSDGSQLSLMMIALLAITMTAAVAGVRFGRRSALPALES